jgi:hypothetical protein
MAKMIRYTSIQNNAGRNPRAAASPTTGSHYSSAANQFDVLTAILKSCAIPFKIAVSITNNRRQIHRSGVQVKFRILTFRIQKHFSGSAWT